MSKDEELELFDPSRPPLVSGGALTGPLAAPIRFVLSGPVHFNAMPTNWLTFNPCGVRINMETGEVVIPDCLSLTDAARAFWDAVDGLRRGAGFR